jgi:hypothetical protein
MFGNWLNGVDRQSKAFIRIGVSALYWSIWRVRNDIIFNKKGHLYGLPLGSASGPTLPEGAAGCYGYWLHTAPDGRLGYLVPGWLSTY